MMRICVTTAAQSITDDELNSAVYIHYEPDKDHTTSGSGFVLTKVVSTNEANNTSQIRIVLVTNKHVLPPENSTVHSIEARITTRHGDKITTNDVTIPVIAVNGKYLPSVSPHPDSRIDVAALDITETLAREGAEMLFTIAEKHSALLTSLLLKKADYKTAGISIGTPIVMLGYPGGIYNPDNAEPILREGVIASEPSRGYSFDPRHAADLPGVIPGFLIDANVFPGSSGSVVIRKVNISPGFNPGGPFSVPYVLGIVADSIPLQDLWGTTRLGIGVVFGADVILETIDNLPGMK